MNGLAMLEALLRDVRYAVRLSARSPAFTATAVLTLAIAIAINTAVFSVVDGVLLKPLPYPAPDNLALVMRTVRGERGPRSDAAVDGRTWEAVRDRAVHVDPAVFSDWATGVNLALPSAFGPGRALYVQQQRVGSGFFAVLGRDRRRRRQRAGPAGWGDNGPISTMPLSYLPLAQMTDGFLRLVHGWFAPAFIVRSTMPVNTTAIELRRALDTVDPLLPFARVQRISDLQATALAQQRFLVALLVALAACAALLSAIGLHGVIATSVTERTREMGIRLALGATRRQAVGSLVLPAIGLAALGTMLGMIAAGTLAPLLRHFLWGVSASDPATFAGVAALLLAVAIAASISPALKILRLDPALTLRQE